VSREYGQFCGLARALEVVGGRWALLIVRELLAGPRRFTELQEGLPGIPSNVLSTRLRELEAADVVGRQLLPRGVAYALTEYGRDLEDAMVRLGLWGARTMGSRRDGEYWSIHSLSLGLRGAFNPDNSGNDDSEYELRIGGQSLRVVIADATVSFTLQAVGDADAIIDTDPDTMYQLLSGTEDVDAALESARLRITGGVTRVRRFFDMFRLAGPAGVRTPGG
jgi:DNA-binding HxlR family transcriptional regulator